MFFRRRKKQDEDRPWKAWVVAQVTTVELDELRSIADSWGIDHHQLVSRIVHDWLMERAKGSDDD